MVKLFEGAMKKPGYVIKAVLLSVAFWVLQFAYQYFFSADLPITSAFIRSFAFAGMTMISLSVLAGPFAVFFPKHGFVPHRRTLGVIGFGFILLHIFSVSTFVFGGNIMQAYFELNPFVNPLIFGAMAQFLFLLLWITSTDWAESKLGYKNWKRIHRLVYFGFIFAILHFSLTNPPAMFTPPGFFLILVTFLAVIFQLAGFAKTFSRKKNTKDLLLGALILLFGLILFWMGFFGG